MGKHVKNKTTKLALKSSSITKQCKTCNDVHPSSNFSIDNKRKDKLQNNCKTCYNQYKRQQRNTEHGFLKKLFDDARCHNRLRNEKGRQHQFTLTLAQVKAKWTAQKGSCAITKMPMTTKPHSDFKCSIERLNNDVGYTDANCVLVISEVNTRNQWTQQKALHLFDNVEYPHMDLADELKTQKLENKHSNVKKWFETEDGTVHCHRCNNTKPRNQFNKNITQGCKDCCRQRGQLRLDSWWGALQNMFKAAQVSASRRKMGFHITLEQLRQILINQGGLCYYSGVSMSPKLGDYRMSMERLDVHQTYTLTNTVLIVQEFQSGDHSRSKTELSNTGSAGWSRDKFVKVKVAFNKQA